MTNKSFIPKIFNQDNMSKEKAREVLKENLSYVDEILREDLGIGEETPQSLPPKPDEPIAKVEIQAQLIDEYMHKQPRYDGYPVVDTDGILYYYRDKIKKLCEISELTKQEQEDHLMVHIRNLADCVHLLPASEQQHHRGIGGLFEHSLECAYFAAEEIKKKVLPSEEADHTPIPKNRWIAAAILAGLFHDVGKVLVNAKIRDAEHKKVYPAYAEKLTPWLLKNIGLGNPYFVTWKAKGREHEAQTALTMLFNRSLEQATRSWMDNTVDKNLGSYLNNSLQSKLRDTVCEADAESAVQRLRFGQFQGVPGNTEDDIEIEMVFETIKQMLTYGVDYKDKNGEPRGLSINGLKLRGWAVNTPNSAAVYSDWDHFYIFWEDFKQMRVDYEIGRRRTSFFNLHKSCSEISLEDWDREFRSLAIKLKKRNYLQTYSDPNDEFFLWDAKRIDPNTGKTEEEAQKAICFNKEGTKKIFENIKRPPTNVQLLSVTHEEPPTDEELSGSPPESVVQETETQKSSQVQRGKIEPNMTDFKGQGKITGSSDEEGSNPPKKTFKNTTGKLTDAEFIVASLLEFEYPTGAVRINDINGVKIIPGSEVKRLINKHGCSLQNIKSEIGLHPFNEFLSLDSETLDLKYKGKRYFRKK